MERANPNADTDLRTGTRTGDQASPASDRHPLARRAWQRVAINHPVMLGGPGGDFAAQAVDLSRGGVLVAVHDPELVGEGGGVAKRVAEQFPDGLEVRFVECGITRHARIARTVVSPGATLGIGCSFDHPLSTREALVLGVVAGETHVPEVRLEMLPFEPRPGSPLTVVLEDQVAGLSGPFAIGPVLGTGEHVVDANVPQSVDSLVASCGDGPFHAAVIMGSERLWEAPATLVACEGHGPDGTRIRLLLESTFDQRLARRLHRKIG